MIEVGGMNENFALIVLDKTLVRVDEHIIQKHLKKIFGVLHSAMHGPKFKSAEIWPKEVLQSDEKRGLWLGLYGVNQIIELTSCKRSLAYRFIRQGDLVERILEHNLGEQIALGNLQQYDLRRW